jgi:integrase
MPRPSKGPRLWLQEGQGRTPRWVIRDGQRNISTGCDERDSAGAQTKLANYILSKHDPEKGLDKNNPNAAKIADVLAVEMKRIAATTMTKHRKDELITVLQNMGNWFGERVVGELDGEVQEGYAQERMNIVTGAPAPVAAYRDLKMLSAAINRYLKRKVGGVQSKFSAVLPDAPEARERWLTRDEAAKLILTAWRLRRPSGISGKPGRHTSRHIARFILTGIYTGSRNGDICGAAVIPTIGRGYVDLDKGEFRRKPDNKKETSKKQPTVPIPPRLLAHMRRWKRLGISNRAVIEFNGKPVQVIKEGWNTVVEKAGLATDDKKKKVLRHTLRHTAITWYLTPDRRTGKAVDIEIVSQFCGVSVATIRKTYRHVMPGTFDPVMAAAHNFGR